MTEKNITRRQFLEMFSPRNLMGVGMAASLPSSLFAASQSLDNPRFSGSRNIIPRLEGPFNIGGINLSVLVTEHTEWAWETYKGQITPIMDQFGVIIPEYFPPEYKDSNPFNIWLDNNFYGSRNRLFDKVEEHAKAKGKEIWVIDPSYNVSFVGFRAGLALTEALTYLTFLRQLAEQRQDLSRGDFFNRMKTAALGVSAFATGIISMPEIMLLGANQRGLIGEVVEPNFRQCVVAESVNQLQNHLPPGSQALLIYPQFHWDGIKGFLDDDQKRTDVFSRYSWLRNVPTFDSFFQSRHFVSDGQNWQRKPGFSL